MYVNALYMVFYSPANSGLKSDLRGATKGCSWAKYVMAHIRNIMAILKITVLLQTVLFSFGAMNQNIVHASTTVKNTPTTV